MTFARAIHIPRPRLIAPSQPQPIIDGMFDAFNCSGYLFSNLYPVSYLYPDTRVHKESQIPGYIVNAQ